MPAHRLSDYKRLVFHIGLHKTGTSYLQSILRANARLLRQAGVHYPEYIDPSRVRQNKGNHSLAVQKADPAAGLWGGLSAMLDLSSDQPTLLISAEDYARKTSLAYLTERVLIEAPDSEVIYIVYLRRYDQLLESAYAQSVRGRYYGPITDTGYNMKFRAVLQRIVSSNKRRSVIIRPYNRALWPGGELGRDFLGALGLAHLWDRMDLSGELAPNHSLPRDQTYILSLLTNLAAKRSMMEFFKISPPGLDPGNSRYFYSPQERREMNAYFLEEDRRLLVELGIEDPETFLDTTTFPDEADWAPFVPDHEAITRYMAQFMDWRLPQQGNLRQGSGQDRDPKAGDEF